MATDTAWAFSHGLISADQKRWLDESYADRLPVINAAIQQLCGCYMTNTAQTADPPFGPIYTYLNDRDVRAALHVPPQCPKITQNWSKQIGDNYQARVNVSFAPVVQELLDGGPNGGQDPKDKLLLLDGGRLRVRAISGLNDAKDCNFLGTGAWLDRLQGDAALANRAAPQVQWKDGQKNVLGFVQGSGQLGWLKVLNAGHMASRDQPHLIHYVLDTLKP
jgi:cathepsin A (carboxypeptidase C)